MTSRPTITPAAFLSALFERAIISESDVVRLLGESRHDPSLNEIEMALTRESVLSREDLLALKKDVSGQPVLEDPTVRVTTGLNAHTSRLTGALVLGRQPLTVAMVEDTMENLQQVAAALNTNLFEVWLLSAPQFAELWLKAYEQVTVDERPEAADLFAILDVAVAERASDVHLKVGVPPSLRVDGAMVQLMMRPLSQTWLKAQIDKITEPRHLADLDRKCSTDLAYLFGKSRFRVNIGQDSNGYTMVLRKLPSQIPTFDDLRAPEAVRRFASLERGMVLVTGPTGSGKSTTLAALLNHIIVNDARHIITLEDPIEFRFPTDLKSMVNQREYGASFYSFADGLRDALRQDPDVILVGEMRDTETIKAALTAAETGHLVFGTLHTINAPQTISRVVNSFAAEEQNAIRAQLAQMLKGVVSQTLLPRASSKGRVAAYEILVSTPAIQTNLRKVDGANQLKQTMQTAASTGMTTIEMNLAQLVRNGVVRKEEAEFRAQDVEEFHRALAHAESQ